MENAAFVGCIQICSNLHLQFAEISSETRRLSLPYRSSLIGKSVINGLIYDGC